MKTSLELQFPCLAPRHAKGRRSFFTAFAPRHCLLRTVTSVFCLDRGGVPSVAVILFFFLAAGQSVLFAQGDLPEVSGLIGQGKLDEAEAKLRLSLKADPNSLPALRLLGIVYQRQEKLPQAEGVLEKAVRVSEGKDLQALFLLSKTRFALKKTREALDLADKLSKLAGNDPQAHFALGRLLRENAATDAAVRELETSREFAPQNPAVTTELITAYLEQGHREKAEALFQPFLESASYDDLIQAGSRFGEAVKFGAAARAFERAVGLQPGSSDAQYDLALAYYRGGDLTKTLNALDQMQRLGGDAQPDFHYLRGKAEADLGHIQAAGEELSKAVEMQPDNESLCADAGLLFFRHDNFWKALEVYEACSKRLPDSVAVATGLALTYFRLGKYDDAARTFRKVLALKADADAAREGLAFLLYVSGSLTEARRVLEQRLGAEDADYYTYFLHALVLLRLDAHAHRAAALQALESALRRNAKFAPAYFERAKIWAAKGDTARALADLERATELDPAYAQPYYLMAQIDFKLGKKAEAEKARRRFAALDREKEENNQKQQVENRLLQSIQ